MSPSSRQSELTRLIAKPFAHRGLHGAGIVENSRAAFEAAIAAGHGIELDVQASADGQAMVFHDYKLERLAGRDGLVVAMKAAELQRLRLTGTDETIPTLAEILALIAGRAPLLIEVKTPERDVAGLSRSVAAALAGYEGAVGVMSFNPEVGRWFARARAGAAARAGGDRASGRGWRGWCERPLALWRARADFLAYDIRDLPSRFATAQKLDGHAGADLDGAHASPTGRGRPSMPARSSTSARRERRAGLRAAFAGRRQLRGRGLGPLRRAAPIRSSAMPSSRRSRIRGAPPRRRAGSRCRSRSTAPTRGRRR